MFEATGGVNTHKGAIFSVSLTLAAYMRLLREHDAGEITPALLGGEISRIARDIPRAAGTHGSNVHKRHNLPGALDNARDGYEQLRRSWLPFMVEHSGSPHCLHLTLLKIMTELNDSNVLHRAGLRGADYLKAKATDLLHDFSLQRMSELNADFIEKNLSPGGAADMLALTLLFNYLSNTEYIHL